MTKNIVSLLSHSLLGALLVMSLLLNSCKQGADSKDYAKELAGWRANRLDRLKGENGWLNLVGLYWLKEGENSFGSDSSNSLIFPLPAAPISGTIVKMDSILTLKIDPAVDVLIDGEKKHESILLSDASGKPTEVRMGNLVFFIIKRENQYGIRLRNLDAPLLHQLDSIPCFAGDTAFIVMAHFIPFEKPLVLKVSTVIGTTEDYSVPGRLEFMVGGKQCSLLPSIEDDGFFILFADGTSARETYGAGRFLKTSRQNSNNQVLIDFNKAYNPPCAFTPFATCPIPPKENLLEVSIPAGEKDVHLYEHE
jgi:uncharacterized protein